MANPIAVNVGTQASQLWSGRQVAGISTLLLMNTDQVNTVMVGTTLNSIVVPIQPNGSLSVDPTENWYVVGTVAGNAPLVVVPNGQSNFLGLSQGYGNIAVPQFQSPNFNAATGAGWALYRDGTATFNEVTIVIANNGVALLIYFPAPGAGNLVGSWAAAATSDQYGNAVPAGINVNGGLLAQVGLTSPSIVSGTIFQALISAATITQSAISNGTMYETTITFDTGGGLLTGYATTVTTVTQTASGTYTQTLPPGVSGIQNAFCWAGGAGGDGGQTSQGGNGGGAGEFAGETSYTPSSNPFTYVVGSGGSNSSTGAGHGGAGASSSIDNGGVLAHGGLGNGTGGTGSTNTIHHNGGTGGTSGGFAGGSSGGNSGNSTAAGNNGNNATSAAGAASPAGQAGSGTGGTGGNSGAAGANGGSPGAGGGGAGKGSGVTNLTKTYSALYVASYYGPDATNGKPNQLRTTSAGYQGGETASGGAANGNQKCVFVFDSDQIAADFAGYTPTGLNLTIENAHTWYSGGTMNIEIDVGASPTKYSKTTAPNTWLGHQNQLATSTIVEGDTNTYFFNSTVAGYFINNQTNFMGLGAFVAANYPYNVNWYGYFFTNVTITVSGTKGTGSQNSGTGSDGKVSFQYVTGQTIVFGLAPQAGSDSAGNAWGAGYTGPVNVFDPNASPAAVEGWHSLTLANGWAKQGYARYKLIGYNQMLIEFQVNDNAATSGTMFNMPAGYTASQTQFFNVALFFNTTTGPAQDNAIAQLSTGAGGAFFILNWAKVSRQYMGNFIISLD